MAKLVVNVPTCALNFCVRWADVDDVVLATFLLHNQNSMKGSSSSCNDPSGIVNDLSTAPLLQEKKESKKPACEILS